MCDFNAQIVANLLSVVPYVSTVVIVPSGVTDLITYRLRTAQRYYCRPSNTPRKTNVETFMKSIANVQYFDIPERQTSTKLLNRNMLPSNLFILQEIKNTMAAPSAVNDFNRVDIFKNCWSYFF